jgi:hypothetical protein
MPNDGFFPQSSHTDAIAVASWPSLDSAPADGRHVLADGATDLRQVVTNGGKVSISCHDVAPRARRAAC